MKVWERASNSLQQFGNSVEVARPVYWPCCDKRGLHHAQSRLTSQKKLRTGLGGVGHKTEDNMNPNIPAARHHCPICKNLCRDRVIRGNHNSLKTHCKRGHPLSGENLRINKRGARVCIACVHENQNERHRRNSAGWPSGWWGMKKNRGLAPSSPDAGPAPGIIFTNTIETVNRTW